MIYALSPAGAWFSPPVSGARPPPCSGFTLTAIDSHRAVLFGGWQPGGGGRVSDLYLIDFNTMVKCHYIVLRITILSSTQYSRVCTRAHTLSEFNYIGCH